MIKEELRARFSSCLNRGYIYKENADGVLLNIKYDIGTRDFFKLRHKPLINIISTGYDVAQTIFKSNYKKYSWTKTKTLE